MLGETIKRLRAAKGWTQDNLADKLYVSTGYISAIETNRRVPSLPTVLKLIELLECSPNELFDFAGTEDNACENCEYKKMDDTTLATVDLMRTLKPEEKFKVFYYAKDQSIISNIKK